MPTSQSTAKTAKTDKALPALADTGTLWWVDNPLMASVVEMNSEIVGFVTERIKEDVKTQHKLLHCKTAEEMQEVQRAFLEDAFEQYTAQMQKVVQMGLAAFSAPPPSGTKHTPV